MIENGKKYLINCDSWFVGPDGEYYSAAWGVCRILTTEELFKFKPLRPSTNWFVQVGEGDHNIIIAGCQIHYAIEYNIKPKKKRGTYNNKDGVLVSINKIYFTEED